MKKAGIVVSLCNKSELLKLTLRSLELAENDIPWEVFIAEEEGPAGINNGITHFLDDGSITHICILNSDVTVAPHWLDMLAADGNDAAGPVTNIAGNEQTIAIDFSAQENEDSFAHVSEFAQKRRGAYEGCSCESGALAFFAVVLRREVVEKVGLLDERFSNGYFADDDYCIRIRNAGFTIRILRDCYIHNWGGGQFSNTLNDDNFVDFQKGQGPFEEKWGVRWQRRGWKLLKSCVQDAEFLASYDQSSSWAQDMLDKGYAEFFNQLREDNAGLRAIYTVELPLLENTRQIAKKIRRRISPSLRDENPRSVKRMKEKEVSEKTGVVERQALESIRASEKKAICIFAPFFTEEKSADGYIQRVKAVDEGALGGFFKVYVNAEKPRISPGFECIDENHIVTWLSPDDGAQAKAIESIVMACGTVYIHSALRAMLSVWPEELRGRILAGKGINVIWDVHGVVPEEYALDNKHYEAQTAGEAEEFLARTARMIIVVNQAMKKHLEKKYGLKPEIRVGIMPVFSEDKLLPVECAEEKTLENGQAPLAVYAGGLQEWQNIGEMQDLIEQAGGLFRYAVFVSRPDEFKRMWGDRRVPEEMQVECKTPQQLKEEYKACHYGFVLRDDIAVNNVACPTKLIEYLQYGIVPVLKTPNIGDFTEMGMEYIDSAAFGKGQLPEEEDRKHMAEKNYEVLKKLTETYQSGKQSVLSGMGDIITV